MMRERGLSVDHVTIFRWVQRYAPEINKWMRPHLRMSGTCFMMPSGMSGHFVATG
jgi:transposase-like protein